MIIGTHKYYSIREMSQLNESMIFFLPNYFDTVSGGRHCVYELWYH